jgi:hypothetical protein
MNPTAVVAAFLLAAGRIASAQSVLKDSTSTLSGVYTAEQAARGRASYAGLCRSCHLPSSGNSFAKLWAGRSVSDLFKYIMETMPDNNPGLLSPPDNADVVGYLLQVAGMPAGARELPMVLDSLKTIKIEMKKETAAPPPSGRGSRLP